MSPSDLPPRLAASIVVDDGDCWFWCRSCNTNGYGQTHWDGTNHLAHRVIYGLLVGPPPVQLHHTCHVHRCVNPAHLEPQATPREHHDRHKAERTHCKAGHEWTPENTYIRANGCRMCRACKAAVMRRRYAALDDATRAADIAARTERRRVARLVLANPKESE